MGPRSFERGNLSTRTSSTISLIGTSMGPRSFERGNYVGLVHLPHPQ